MAASEAAVKAAMEALGCEQSEPFYDVYDGATVQQCHTCEDRWTDRGCASAVNVADIVAAIAAREALQEAAMMLAPPDPHNDAEECETCWTVRWLRARAES